MVPPRKLQLAHGGIERGEQPILDSDVGFGQGVEERRLACVCVSDDRGDWKVRLQASLALGGSGAINGLELLFDLGDALQNPAPIRL